MCSPIFSTCGTRPGAASRGGNPRVLQSLDFSHADKVASPAAIANSFGTSRDAAEEKPIVGRRLRFAQVPFRRVFPRIVLAALAMGVLSPSPSFAAEPLSDFLASKPSIRAVRIDASEAPEIDGDLSDPGWARAALIDEFRQRSPDPGAAATERTTAQLMYDENNLYIGIYAYDSAPDQLVIRTMQRDGQVWSGDNIFVTLDPGPTWRNAYTFQIGASGGRQDALRLNNTAELNAWDTIWSVQTRIVSNGYIVEMAIPFRSLSYPPGPSDWGLEIGRTVRRTNESIRWSTVDPAANFADVSQAGIMTGISDVNQGLGLDIQPYVLFGAKHNWQQPGDGAGLTGTMGGNLFYKITPALTGTLTLNTDFSDAPLDTRQINTTRFSLFFPETRDFFLQDAGAFQFGGRAYNRGFDRSANNGLPFFSRNIGLAGGVPVSIVVGGKVSGEFAGFEVGALSVLTDNTSSADHQILSVARITHPIMENAKLGMIFTNGDPTGETNNSVLGGDFQYQTTSFLGNKILTADASYQRSFSDDAGEDDSFAIALNFPNEPWGGDFTAKQVGQNFSPELGFANRTGIRLYELNVRRVTRYQNSWARTTVFGTGHTLVTRLDNEVETRESYFFGELETAPNDVFSVTARNILENIPEDFDLPGDVVVPEANYNWTYATLRFHSSSARPLSIEAAITCCAFFDGTNVAGALIFTYRPNQYFSGQFAYEPSFIDLPGGNVNIHLYKLEGAINFNPDMSVAFQAQYDNLSRSLGALARYRWEYSPGNELLIAYGQSADIPHSRIRAQTSQFTLRLVRTFQF